MNVLKSIHCQRAFTVTSLLVLAVLILPPVAHAQQNWTATVSGQSPDMAKQAVAFKPIQ